LHVEPLEDRRMLSGNTVNNLLDVVNGDVSSVSALHNDDGGDGISLREAISAALNESSSHGVHFDPVLFSTPQTISINSTLPTLDAPISILGPGAELLTIDAGGGTDGEIGNGDGFRIFNIDDDNDGSNIDVSISGLTLTGGDPNPQADGFFGGGIYNNENLVLTHSRVVENAASFGGGVANFRQGQLTLSHSTLDGNQATDNDGGGLVNAGVARVTGSTVSNNTALGGSGDGGGIANDSFGTGAGQLVLAESTITGNSAAFRAGGVHNYNATATITSSTITGNTGSFAGGLQHVATGGSEGRLHLIGSIVWDNNATQGGGVDEVRENTLATNRDNLIGFSPFLFPLEDNGGPTATHALSPFSNVIDVVQRVPLSVYEFSTDAGDLLSSGELTTLGGATTASGYDFDANAGLNIASAAMNPSDYLIEMTFAVDSLLSHQGSSYQKIVDFKQLDSDPGLYVRSSGAIEFYLSAASSWGVVSAGVEHTLAISRDAETQEFVATLDGTEVLSFIDTAGNAVFDGPENLISLFQDDFVISSGTQPEAGAGVIRNLRISGAPLTDSYDQRGEPFARLVGDGVDIGAFEFHPEVLFGDADNNGVVSGSDLLAVTNNFGATGIANGLLLGDADDNGTVSGSDLLAVTNSFGSTLGSDTGSLAGANTLAANEAAFAIYPEILSTARSQVVGDLAIDAAVALPDDGTSLLRRDPIAQEQVDRAAGKAYDVVFGEVEQEHEDIEPTLPGILPERSLGSNASPH